MIESLSPDMIARQILTAESRFLYAAPSATLEIAAAVVTKFRLLGPSSCAVLLDVSPEVFRLGYGQPEVLDELAQGNVPIRQVTDLHLGVLVVDDHGWLFAPVPLLVAGEARAGEFRNAVRLVPTQIDSYLKTIGLFAVPADRDIAGKLGGALVDDSKRETVKKELEEIAPLKFDLERQVRVFKSILEFVEAEMSGGRLSSRKVKLPAKLLVGVSDPAVTTRLSASYSVIDSRSDVLGVSYRSDLDELLKAYNVHSLGKALGRVILIRHKPAFAAKVEALKARIDDEREKVKADLKKQLKKSLDALVASLLPGVVESPPTELVTQLTGPVTEAAAGDFLRREFEKIFPTPNELVDEIQLTVVYKGVTYEMIRDPDFRKKFSDAYPHVKIDHAFEEFTAAKESASGGSVGTPKG